CGVIFKLTRKTGGGWVYRVLYGFQGPSDGGGPVATLILDGAGSLYGVANPGISGIRWLCGNVFKPSPTSDDAYSFSVLYSFQGAPDGCSPSGRLLLDGNGNLFGTTTSGGSANKGSIFELVPGADDQWTENVVYSFHGPDGSTPV